MKKNLIFEKYQKDYITYDEFLSFCKENLPKLDDEEVFDEELYIPIAASVFFPAIPSTVKPFFL